MSSGTISLEHIYERNQKDEIFLLGKMEIPEQKPFYIGSFKFLDRDNAVFHAVINKDYEKARECFYRIGMTDAYLHEKLGQDVFLGSIDSFLYPLLSDNRKLIEKYMSYNNPSGLDSFITRFAEAVKSAYLDNESLLADSIAGLKKRGQKGFAKPYLGVVDVFQGILDNNPKTVEDGLIKILSIHAKQEQPSAIKDYINIEATGLAKLAMYKGIRIEIDSPLLLSGLLEIKELPLYKGYPFFAELY